MINKLLGKLGFSKKMFFAFLLVVVNSNLIYSISGVRGVLYNPYLDVLGVSNAQLGILIGLTGALSTFGNVPLGWIQDLLSPRKVLAIDTMIVGATSLYICFAPNLTYTKLLVCFAVYGLFSEPLYWASYLKSIRSLARDDKQATAFGFAESGRSMTGLIYQMLSLMVFTVLGSSVFGMRTAMMINACLTIGSGVLIWFFMPEVGVVRAQAGESQTKLALSGVLKALKMPEVWLTGIAASCVYAIYCCTSTYFIPYLQDVFLLPAALVGVFGLVNSQVVSICSTPVSGILADQKFKSSAHWMRICYVGLAIMLTSALILPKTKVMVIPCMVILMASALCVYLVRGIYYAPIGEAGVPREMSATAMSVASAIGYSPMMWAYPVYGKIIDSFDAQKAYQIIFTVVIGMAIAGVATTTVLGRRIMSRRQTVCIPDQAA